MGNFSIGDQVQLKSGGPVMTVASDPGDHGKVLCQYFDGNTLKEVWLLPAMLDEWEA